MSHPTSPKTNPTPELGAPGGEAGMSELGLVSVLSAFAGASGLALYGVGPGGAVLDVTLFAVGVGSFVSSFVWIFVLALSRRRLWVVGMLIPYVNLLVASAFARRFWNEGARAPALLGFLGGILYPIGYLRLLLGGPPLV